MDTLLLTLLMAFAIVIIAIALLALSWLFTGKSSLRPGACGRDPTKKRTNEEGCGTKTSCQLCEHPEKKKETPKEEKEDDDGI